MRFAEPFWLWTGALVVGLLLILRVRSERLTTRAVAELLGARLIHARAIPSLTRRTLRVAAVCFAVAMGFVALARPQKGMQWQTLDRHGTDLLLVVDTSKSMNADDVAPTRLERTKLAIRDLVERFPGDRIGLVAFAGDAFVESPMTLDHDALLETLGAFDTSIISRGGTDVGRAIDVGQAALNAESADDKVMVLLTDGEDLESRGLEAAKRAAEAGITIHTVGVGTAAGELVPAINDRGVAVGLMRDENGAPVRSRLDEAGLRAIAQAAHGTYRPLGADGRGLDRLYAETLAPLSHTQQGARVRRVYAEWFAVPLALSLFGIVLDALLGWRPRSRERAKRPPLGSRLARRGASVAAVASMALFSASASASVRDAEKAYAAGRFEDAARGYEAEQARHPGDARLAIDDAVAAYRAGHYDAAEAALGRALPLADPKLQQRVLYDVGDARYRLGATTLSDAPDKTIERWKAAIAAYDGAIALAPADADARFNRDFVQRKLSELENKQKQQPKEPPKDKPSKGDSKGQDSQKNSPAQSEKDSTGQDSNKDQPAQNGGASGTSSDGTSHPNDTKPNGTSGGGGSRGQRPSGATPGGDSPDGPRPDPAGAPGPGGKDPRSTTSSSTHVDPGNAGESDGSGAAPGHLSRRDARALLQSLRGEERRGVNFGTRAAPPSADSPLKDW
jgi:Ca-activated chloride channel family protein